MNIERLFRIVVTRVFTKLGKRDVKRNFSWDVKNEIKVSFTGKNDTKYYLKFTGDSLLELYKVVNNHTLCRTSSVALADPEFFDSMYDMLTEVL